MSIAITEEHAALASAARRFLADRCPPAVLRAALDAETETIPPFWAELAGLGWLGLHVDARDGGQGFGLAELAVVVEELGRVGAPGPFLPTVLAAAAVARGTPALCDRVLPDLVAGRAVGAVAFPASTSLEGSTPDGDGTVTVSGTARPVPGAALADWVVVAARCPDGERWCVLPTSTLEVTELPSLDPTRRSGAVTAVDLRVRAVDQLPVSRREVDDLVVAVVAAECAGGAAW
ncbi:MAG: acyl-CoA dehydrogenase family protein, partial [Actinomycetes bacterium]